MGAVKYNFDCTFHDDADAAAESAAADRAAELDGARSLAYADGFAEGEAQMRASLDAHLQLAHANIEAQLATLITSITATQRLLLADATACVATLAEAVAGEALLHLPVDRIEGVVAPLLSELLEIPRLVIRIAPGLFDAVKLRLEDVAVALGFGGKLIFLAEDDLQQGDVLVEWANGGLDARLDQTRQKIKSAVQNFVLSALTNQNIATGNTQ